MQRNKMSFKTKNLVSDLIIRQQELVQFPIGILEEFHGHLLSKGYIVVEIVSRQKERKGINFL